MAKSNAERQAAYRARLRNLGLTQALVVVPKERVQEIQEIADQMCRDAGHEVG